MDSKNFIFFQYDTGLLFETPLTDSKVENAFEVLSKLKSFDGSKKLEKSKEGVQAVLTTADSNFELTVSNEDLSVTYTNRSFSVDASLNVQQVNALLLEASQKLDFGPIDQARARQIIFSPKIIDRKHITTQVIASDLRNYIDTLDVDFNFDEPDIEGKKVSSWVKVSYAHTTEMHEVAEKLNKKSILENLIVLYVGVGYDEKISSSQTTAFLNSMVGYHTSFKVLERFGYGS